MPGSIRVLYVDDNPHDRALVKDALEREKSVFKLTLSSNRKEFEQLLYSRQWDVVLSDFNILGYTGLQVIQAVKKHTPDTPVIIITGTGSEQTAVEAMKEGASDYVIKSPAHIKRLSQSIRKAIQLQKAENEKTRAERDLKNREAELLRAQRVAHIGNWTYDPATQEPSWSEEMFRILGLVGRTEAPKYDEHRKILHPDDWELFDTSVRKAVNEGKGYDLELRIVRPDSEVRHIHTKCEALKDETGRVAKLIGTAQDITERKKAAEALENERSFLSTVLDNLKEAIVICDAKGSLARFNEAARRLHGIPEKPVLSHQWAEHYDLYKNDGKTPLPVEEIPLFRAWKGERVRDAEIVVSPRHGSPHFLICNAQPLKDSEGGIIGAVAAMHDITEKKRVEQSLRESEERFRELFQKMPSGVIVYEAMENGGDFIIKDCNRFAEKIENIEAEKVIGQRVTKVFPGISAFGFLDVLRKVLKTGRAEFFPESFYRDDRNPGSWRECWAYKLPSGDIVAVYNDVTARKEAEERILRIQTRLTTLVDNLIDSIVVTDSNGKIRFVNNAAVELFGRDKDDLVGAEIGFPISPDKIFEIATNRPDGKIRHAEAKSTMIDWDGDPSYLISLRDITQKKRDMLEREKINAHLRQVDKIESIGNLAGGIAHDFNNMLSVILGYGEELLDSLLPTDPLHASVREIVEAGRRSADLTRQLLAFSRRQTLQPEILDLNFVVINIENMLRRLIGEDIELKTILADELDRVKVDPGQIQQVIVNLAVNARDAMPKGGKLTIETANVELDQQYAENHGGVTPGDYVMLSFTDSGYGMDEKTRARIFEPFFTTKQKGKGTGLGLSTVYGIIKQSGGNIWVYSEPGQGATFKIYLPKTAGEVSEKKAEGADNEPAGKNEMVLVVEDEPSLRKLCEKMLKRLNYRVTVAANGGEALLLVEEKKLRPDLIVTDVVMPEMSGKVLVDRLKKKLPDLKVLFMSGYTDNAIVHHGVLESGTPFIQKPFSKDKLGKAVRLILEGA